MKGATLDGPVAVPGAAGDLAKDKRSLLTAKSILRGSIWNLAGQAAPVAAGLLLIPGILSRLGNERFGLLTMAWMLIGYFGFLDLGLTRAITQLVATGGEEATVRREIGIANALLLGLGSFGGALFAMSSGLLAVHLFRVPATLEMEVRRSLMVIGLALPITLLTSAYRSIAEGKFAFARLNAIRIPLGVANYLVPWMVLHATARLDSVIAALMGLRVVGLALHVSLVNALMGKVGLVLRHSWSESVRLLKFGGWVTISNLVSPLMTQVDRFVIGAMLSLTAVAYYAAPYEAVTKLWIVAGAVGGVVFPHFSRAQDDAAVRKVFRRGILLIVATLSPVVCVLLVWAQPLIRLWINADFALQAAPVARVLAVAVFINSIAIVPFCMIQGQGRPDVTARFHLVELPVYAVALVASIGAFGINGAALAYLMRVTVDAALLLWYGQRFLARREISPG